MKVQDSVKKETQTIFLFSLALCIVMFIVFFVLHRVLDGKIPFDYRVILGGVGGTIVACMNFFLMGLMVQDVASTDDQELAAQKVRVSYRNRTMMQVIWMVLCMVVPQIQIVAGLLPLLFPGIIIKVRGILIK